MQSKSANLILSYENRLALFGFTPLLAHGPEQIDF